MHDKWNIIFSEGNFRLGFDILNNLKSTQFYKCFPLCVNMLLQYSSGYYSIVNFKYYLKQLLVVIKPAHKIRNMVIEYFVYICWSHSSPILTGILFPDLWIWAQQSSGRPWSSKSFRVFHNINLQSTKTIRAFLALKLRGRCKYHTKF